MPWEGASMRGVVDGGAGTAFTRFLWTLVTRDGMTSRGDDLQLSTGGTDAITGLIRVHSTLEYDISD